MNWLAKKYWYCRLAGSPYQRLFDTKASSKLVSLNCETTSIDPKRAEVTSIAFTFIVDNQILTSTSRQITLKTYYSFNQRLENIASKYQGSEHDNSQKQAIEQLINAIGNATLIGYNIQCDKKILDKACRKHLGFPLPNPVIEISQLYQKQLERLLPNHYSDLSLDTICHHLKIPPHHRYNVLSDAITVALIYLQLTYGSMPPFTDSQNA